MKSFYKLNGTTAEIGAGSTVPEGYIEYQVGQEPQELQDALALQAQVDAQEQAKQAKQLALDSITVTTTSGKVFDGREKDIPLMTGAIDASTVLGLTEHHWKLHDNTVALVSIDELKEALVLSMQAIGTLKLS